MRITVKAQTDKPYLKETIRVKNFMLAISGVNESGFRKEKDEYKKPVVELQELECSATTNQSGKMSIVACFSKDEMERIGKRNYEVFGGLGRQNYSLL